MGKSLLSFVTASDVNREEQSLKKRDRISCGVGRDYPDPATGVNVPGWCVADRRRRSDGASGSRYVLRKDGGVEVDPTRETVYGKGVLKGDSLGLTGNCESSFQ